MFTSGETNGVIAPVKPEQMFRFARTHEGDVYIHPTVAKEHLRDLVEGAQVKLSYKSGGIKGLVAEEILSVRSPAPPTFYVGEVKFFDTKKGYGFICNCEDLPGIEVFVHAVAFGRAGIVPAREMKIEFSVTETGGGRFKATKVRPISEPAAIVRQKKTAPKQTSAALMA